MRAKRNKIWPLSLGCPKNRVDTERTLAAMGFELEEALGRADVAFINTCAFIEPATRESVRAILDTASRIAKFKKPPLLAVAGCLPGRYGAELAKEIPEVDLWLPAKETARWPLLIMTALGRRGRLKWLAQRQGPRVPSSGPGHAWLKIADGCGRQCSFCVIPQIRGPLKSEPAEAVLREARELLDTGTPELCLVAQDTTAWGRDLSLAEGPKNLAGLIRALGKIKGKAWLRLLYLYPTGITDELLEAMGEAGALPYFDVPLQHVDDGVLEGMGRPWHGFEPMRLVEKIRAAFPAAAIRTTFITGFPGETEGAFQRLLDFVAEARLDSVGVFPFYAEEGAKAASLPSQVAPETGADRRARLMETAGGISARKLAAHAGKVLDVIVERPQGEWPGLFVGRAWFQAPEADGITYVSGENTAPGDVVKCEIQNTHVYDLDGLVIDD